MDEAAYLDQLHALWEKNWPAEAPRAPVYPLGEVPLTDYPRHWAAIQPDRPAIIFYGTEITWAQLDRLSDAFAALLVQHGVARGDRVAVFLPTCPQFLIAFLGILKRGAMLVPVNPMFRAMELEYELNDTGAVAILAQDSLMDLVRAVAPNTSLRRVFATSIVGDAARAPRRFQCRPAWRRRGLPARTRSICCRPSLPWGRRRRCREPRSMTWRR